MDLPPFSEHPECPKCGWSEIGTCYKAMRADIDFLQLICHHCGYEWRMACKDSVYKTNPLAKLAPEGATEAEVAFTVEVLEEMLTTSYSTSAGDTESPIASSR